jgi:hypothetical protein
MNVACRYILTCCGVCYGSYLEVRRSRASLYRSMCAWNSYYSFAICVMLGWVVSEVVCLSVAIETRVYHIRLRSTKCWKIDGSLRTLFATSVFPPQSELSYRAVSWDFVFVIGEIELSVRTRLRHNSCRCSSSSIQQSRTLQHYSLYTLNAL